ncbi:hypothetical protein MUN84_09495 [Hymenobacter sp. 5516J-16]|uniref:DUF6985 domain-containing protein n=1 Tax=Hymenobacter sublimis TaxID=2933777 RepID=A0ABY4J8B8_9BACT|nr:MULTISPECIES: hypothetical protein [Hymenobacter]UOQ78739.1 hypothetical protein MUN84_09495 [Hymenobacter sp. 5516J-16]UPL48706.1 hypothetical protein MWH26_16140 [Hymenobacter sublimis]
MSNWKDTVRTDEFDDLVAEVSLNLLQATEPVRLCFGVDTTLEEAKAAEVVVNELLQKLPSLEGTIANAAFKYYQLLVKALSEYGESYSLPVADDAAALRQFYQLMAIHLPFELEAGHFGLEFRCEFEEEHGMGIRFRNWQIEEVGDGSEAFSLD